MRWLALVACLISFSAAADENADKARAAYRDAQKALNAGRCDQAVPKLVEGLRLLPVAKALTDLGDCLVKLGRLDDASTAYRQFLERYPEHAAADRVRADLEKVEAQQQAKRELAEKEKLLPPPPAQPEPKPAPPPEKPKQAEVPPPALPTTAAPGAPAEPKRVWTWVAGAGAAVAVGTGIFFGQKSKSTAQSLQSTEHPGSEVVQLQNDYTSQARTANILLGVGLGLAAVSATLFVLHY